MTNCSHLRAPKTINSALQTFDASETIAKNRVFTSRKYKEDPSIEVKRQTAFAPKIIVWQMPLSFLGAAEANLSTIYWVPFCEM